MTKISTRDLARELDESYEQFKEKSLSFRRFKHSELESILQNYTESLHTREIGRSEEDRAVYELKAGKGKTNVLLWSQMHGDEPTATMALADVFRFLTSDNDGFEKVRKLILRKLSLYFIPMLNPDGAERYQRRNAPGIDLNRDFLDTVALESQILRSRAEDIQPAFGFNLHDQKRHYAAGFSGKPSTIAFLAPAFNEELEFNETRSDAAKLISQLTRTLKAFIPGNLAKYDDAHNERCFGDGFQAAGIRIILIESGAYIGDREKQYIRKLNFITLITAFVSIAEGQYKEESFEEYDDLPFNRRERFHDLILRNVTLNYKGRPYKVDLAFDTHEEPDEMALKRFRFTGELVNMGRLDDLYGFEEFDCANFRVEYENFPETGTNPTMSFHRSAQKLFELRNGAILKS